MGSGDWYFGVGYSMDRERVDSKIISGFLCWPGWMGWQLLTCKTLVGEIFLCVWMQGHVLVLDWIKMLSCLMGDFERWLDIWIWGVKRGIGAVITQLVITAGIYSWQQWLSGFRNSGSVWDYLDKSVGLESKKPPSPKEVSGSHILNGWIEGKEVTKET